VAPRSLPGRPAPLRWLRMPVAFGPGVRGLEARRGAGVGGGRGGRCDDGGSTGSRSRSSRPRGGSPRARTLDAAGLAVDERLLDVRGWAARVERRLLAQVHVGLRRVLEHLLRDLRRFVGAEGWRQEQGAGGIARRALASAERPVGRAVLVRRAVAAAERPVGRAVLVRRAVAAAERPVGQAVLGWRARASAERPVGRAVLVRRAVASAERPVGRAVLGWRAFAAEWLVGRAVLVRRALAAAERPVGRPFSSGEPSPRPNGP
jgi:hypothetical protein